MKHWIIDDDLVCLPTWTEALPQARIIRRDQVSNVSGGEQGILWFRLRASEPAASVLASVQIRPGCFIVVLADEPDELVVTAALASGASGCCNTRSAPEVLRQVALVVANGGLWIGQSLLLRLVGSTASILEQRVDKQKGGDWSAQLSEREAQVGRLVAGGASNKEIAAKLFITERTVKAHLTAIFEKLGLRDRLQLSLRINGMSI